MCWRAATNFEEEKESEVAEANDDGALMHFEFLEALVRCSLAKVSPIHLCISSYPLLGLVKKSIQTFLC